MARQNRAQIEEWAPTYKSAEREIASGKSSGAICGLQQIAPGDYALEMASDPNLNSTDFGTAWYRDWHFKSVKTFQRGDNLRVMFKVWGDPHRPGPNAGPFPSGIFINGPWWQTGALNSVGAAEAGGWAHSPQLWAENGQWFAGVPMSDDFKYGLYFAVDKPHALTIRVWLGDKKGGKCEWTTGTVFNPEIDTRATTSLTAHAAARLGWSNYDGTLIVDDIVVEQDMPNTASQRWLDYD